MRDIEAASRLRVKRRNIFVRILEALHASRRLEVQHVLRRYEHLIERHQSIAAVGIVPDGSRAEEGHRNAHGSNSSSLADDRTHRNPSPRNRFA
jgi:hypothetical protein